MAEAVQDRSDRNSLDLFGLVLVRIVVPAWILAGVLLKFASRDPSLMPKQFRAILHGIGLDLKISLAILLGIEIAAIAIMLFVPKLARLMSSRVICRYNGMLNPLGQTCCCNNHLVLS